MIRHTKQHRDTLDPANPRDYLGYFFHYYYFTTEIIVISKYIYMFLSLILQI